MRILDTECYPDYWLCKLDNPVESFQMFPGHPLDTVGLRRALSLGTCVGFNSSSYDMPIIELALQGADNATLKQRNDEIIVHGVRYWHHLDWVDHIDIIDVLPGEGGLKAYGGKMHAPMLQDLPIEPSASIGLFDRCLLRDYCGNDLATTRLGYEAMASQLKLREELSVQYGTDLRSKSDAQIAEAAMRSLLGYRPEPPKIAPGTPFNYRAPPWLHYVTPTLQRLLITMVTLPFTVNETGGVSPHFDNHFIGWGQKQQRWVAGAGYVGRPKGWLEEPVQIGRAIYTVGTGGLHSNEQQQVLRATPDLRVTDSDVTGYYPKLIEQTGIYPPQIGPQFNEIYSGWIDTRTSEKTEASRLKKELTRLEAMLEFLDKQSA